MAGSQIRISIHAPRAGSDSAFGGDSVVQRISIHAPRAGSDHGVVVQYVGARAFQSTLPVRGATGLDTPACNAERISIHAPRAGSDKKVDKQALFTEISIHAPRAGSDSRRTGACRPVPYFNPRSPCGERLADF